MSQDKNLIAAIDIGTTKIVAIVGRLESNGLLEVLGMEKIPSKGVKRGVIHSIEETIDAIDTVVGRLQTKLQLKIETVYVGIAGQHIRSIKHREYKYINHEQSEVRIDDINELIDKTYRIPVEVGEQILHVIPQDYVIDKEAGVQRPIGMSGRRLDGNYNIIIGRTASARNIEKCIKEVGIEIEELVLEPIASSLAVLTEEEKQAGVVLVDIGGGTTDLAIYLDGILRHTAVIPFGGDIVTRDIKEGCSVLVRQAEALKIQFGEAIAEFADGEKVVTIPSVGGWDPKEISFKSLAHIIQCRMEEVIESVKFQIEVSGVKEKIGAGIVLTGGGAMLNNLDKLTKNETELDVRLGTPGISSKIVLEKDLDHTMYATGIGLLLRGVETIHNDENNNDTNKSSKRKKKGMFKIISSFFDTTDSEM